MAECEKHSGEDDGRGRRAGKIGDAVEDVATKNHLFAKRGERPDDDEADECEFDIADERLELIEILALMKDMQHHRFRDVCAEELERDGNDDRDHDRFRPTGWTPQSDVAPAETTKSQRDPADDEERQHLADRDEAPSKDVVAEEDEREECDFGGGN